MMHPPPGTALAVACFYFIGKSATKPQSKARLALICGLGVSAVALIAWAVAGLVMP
jgi:hypothetical protein